MSTTEASESHQHTTPELSATKNSKGRSCVLCQQRKVRCDRKDPCSACTRARVECIVRAPAPPRRRSRKPPDSDLLARLTRYEQILPSFGSKIDGADGRDAMIDSGGRMEQARTPERIAGNSRKELSGAGGKLKNAISPDVQTGRSIDGEGKTKYLENNSWTSLSNQLRDSQEIFQGSSEDEKIEQATRAASRKIRPDGGHLIFASDLTDVNTLHPQPVQIFRLWQTFLDNVNPLVKILHTPTVQQLVLEASGSLKSISKAINALMFAIYFSAVNSLSNAECEGILSQPKTVLLAKYYMGTQQALISAGFLKSSDLIVLQAYVLFLLSVRQFYDAHTLWTLTGIAIRIGQRIGLHHDGASLGLPIFETELRRRLWWQIILLDGRSAELSGSGTSLLAPVWDTKIPLNVNDSDLNPNMQEMPVEHTGLTEMVFCLLRFECGTLLHNSSPTSSFDGSWQKLSSTHISIAEKDKAIEDLERILEQKFLRFCDPSVPLHFQSVLVGRATVCMMRMRAHHPRHHSDGGTRMPQNEKDILFSDCVKVLELDSLNHSTQITQRFLWHAKSYFQWHALIYALSELCSRTGGDEADRAWQQITEVYSYHPELLTDRKNALSIAIGNLTIQAWEAREIELERQQRRPHTRPPNFISNLYSQRETRKALLAPTLSPNEPMITTSDEPLARDRHARDIPEREANMYDATSSGPAKPRHSDSPLEEHSPADWAEWDNLIRDFELQPIEATDLQIFEHL